MCVCSYCTSYYYACVYVVVLVICVLVFTVFCIVLCFCTVSFVYIYSYLLRLCGPGSSVGIATELRAGRSGIESR